MCTDSVSYTDDDGNDDNLNTYLNDYLDSTVLILLRTISQFITWTLGAFVDISSMFKIS